MTHEDNEAARVRAGGWRSRGGWEAARVRAGGHPTDVGSLSGIADTDGHVSIDTAGNMLLLWIDRDSSQMSCAAFSPPLDHARVVSRGPPSPARMDRHKQRGAAPARGLRACRNEPDNQEQDAQSDYHEADNPSVPTHRDSLHCADRIDRRCPGRCSQFAQ
ncbi:MAG: hypothetical protein AB7K09_07425 [Planctomycetota bacterium]